MTSAARTLIDIAAEVTERVLRRAVNQALVNRLTTEQMLSTLLEHRASRPGERALRQLLARSAVGTRSDMEDAALDLIDRHGLERPRVNKRVYASGRPPGVDLSWPAQRLAVELDSERYHDNVIARANDAANTAALRRAGWTVVRLTWSDVVHHEQDTVHRLGELLRA